MGTVNYRQVFAKKNRNRQRILEICPDAQDVSGIYFFVREENGFKFAYIGQAVKVLSRLASHLDGYDQHIDLSIKKHGLWSDKKPNGWKVHWLPFKESELNDKEQYFIKQYANAGYQLRNTTSGSQGTGKFGITNNKTSKGYRDGIKYGRNKLKKELKALIDKYLIINTKNESKLAQNALIKFNDLLQEEE